MGAAELEPGRRPCSRCLTWPASRPFADPEARGALAGLTLLTGRTDIYRAFVDSIALAALAVAELLPVTEAWRASGGGCRNPAWVGATCDALDAPVEVVEYAGDAVGPALLALRSLGLEPPVRVETRSRARRRSHPALPRSLGPLAGYLPAAETAPGGAGTVTGRRRCGRTPPRCRRHSRGGAPGAGPGPGELLVRIEACGLCPTDVRKYELGLMTGAYP